MIVNWAIDTTRSLSPSALRLRLRARGLRRAPLIVVPPMLGTRLRDEGGRRLWGWTRNVFTGPAVGSCPNVVVDGPLERLPLIPGFYARDVHRGMIEYLCRVGGYRRGRDLFVLAYDWRRGVAHAAERLADLVADVSRRSGSRVDLACASSAGLVARYYLLYGGRDVLGEEQPELGHADSGAVRRVVYMGSPQRGTLEALNVAVHGLCLLPYIGRRHPTRDIALCQIVYDLLPHPDDPVAVDARMQPISVDLYDARTWRELGLAKNAPHDLASKLERARRLHRALERPAPDHDAFVIGARHRPTRVRFVVSDGQALVKPCAGRELCEPGDSSVTAASLVALPGVRADRIRWVEPRVHHDLPSDPSVHVHILRALLEDDERPSDLQRAS